MDLPVFFDANAARVLITTRMLLVTTVMVLIPVHPYIAIAARSSSGTIVVKGGLLIHDRDGC